MMDRINFAVGAICGAVAAIVFLAVVFLGHTQASDRYWNAHNTCVASGGAWIPTSDHSAVCLRPPA